MTLRSLKSQALIYTGQSLMLAPDTTFRAPEVIAANLSVLRPHVVTNTLNTSYTARNLLVTGAVDPYAKKFGYPIDVDVGGSTDIFSDLKTAAQIIALSEAYWTARKAAGFKKVIGCTVPNSTLYDVSGTQAVRAAYNVLVLASVVPDAIADIAALPNMQNPLDTTYFSDQIHPTAAGAIEYANCLIGALATLGVT